MTLSASRLCVVCVCAAGSTTRSTIQNRGRGCTRRVTLSERCCLIKGRLRKRQGSTAPTSAWILCYLGRPGIPTTCGVCMALSSATSAAPTAPWQRSSDLACAPRWEMRTSASTRPALAAGVCSQSLCSAFPFHQRKFTASASASTGVRATPHLSRRSATWHSSSAAACGSPRLLHRPWCPSAAHSASAEPRPSAPVPRHIIRSSAWALSSCQARRLAVQIGAGLPSRGNHVAWPNKGQIVQQKRATNRLARLALLVVIVSKTIMMAGLP